MLYSCSITFIVARPHAIRIVLNVLLSDSAMNRINSNGWDKWPDLQPWHSQEIVVDSGDMSFIIVPFLYLTPLQNLKKISYDQAFTYGKNWSAFPLQSVQRVVHNSVAAFYPVRDCFPLCRARMTWTTLANCFIFGIKARCSCHNVKAVASSN